MRVSVTIIMTAVFLLSSMALAEKKPKLVKGIDPAISEAPAWKSQLRPVTFTEPNVQYYTPTYTQKERWLSRLHKAQGTAYHVQIDSSKNGYGWLNPAIRALDRYKGTDIWDGGAVDMLLVAYRQAIPGDDYTGHIGAHEIDVSNGLEGSTKYRAEQINGSLEGQGGRYPGVVAGDYPLVAFNWYVRGDAQTEPAFSHPYLMTDFNAWRDPNNPVEFFDWTTPDYKMDEGWLHPDIEATDYSPFQDWKENRLWNGSVDVVKDAGDEYRYAAIYENWILDSEVYSETDNYGLESDDVILNAHTDDPAFGWTFGWDEGNDPHIINPEDALLLNKALDMNDNGFGAVAAAGRLGYYHPDSALYYDTLQVVYTTTDDYGLTWSAPDTVGFAEMGLPAYHHAEDSLITYYDENDSLISYEGPTEVYMQSDIDVLVSDNDDIYIACNLMWGRPSGAHGLVISPYYSGQWVAIFDQDSSYWTGRHIAYMNGVFEGDEYVPNHFAYYWGSEIDLAFDDTGNLFASWLDRRRTDVELGELPRYSNNGEPADSSDHDYKADIYVSRSWNGGFSWNSKVNITDSPTIDEYELKLSKHVDSRNDGTVWVGYSLCTDPSSGDLSADAYVDLPNQVWIGEGSGLFPPSSIDREEETVIRAYALSQNYPNPFNPTTNIEFTPMKAGKAKLEVFNIQGRKISTLFEGKVDQGRSYKVQFDGSGIASGIYFYKLNVGDQVEVRKMALVK